MGWGRCRFARWDVELGIYDPLALYEIERNTSELSSSVQISHYLYYVISIAHGTAALLS